MTTTTPFRRKRHRDPKELRTSALRVAAALSAALVVGVPVAFISETITAVEHQAEAAITNGAQLMGEYGLIGNFRESSTGLYIYCMDSTADWPAGQTFPGFGTPVSTLDSRDWAGSPAALSGVSIGQMNYIVSKWGQTGDAVQAAAVQIALFAYAKSSIPLAKTYIGDAEGYADIISALVDQYITEAGATVTGASSSGGGQLTFHTDPTNNYNGTLDVSLTPADATGTVTLSSGIFTETGTNTISGVGSGAVLAVRGVAPDDNSQYKIGGSGTFNAGTWANHISMADYGGSGQQRMLIGTGPSAIQFSLEASDPSFRSATFQPAGTTVVPLGVMAEGAEMLDVLRPSTLPDSTGLNNPWKQRSNGTYLPGTYRATAYLIPPEDYPADPAGVFEIPASAVEVATTTVTTGDLGPTVEYPYSLGEAPGPGRFVIVIGFEEADQVPLTQLFIPDGWSWRDNFGQHIESILVPNITTKAKPDYFAHELVWDDVIVEGELPEGGVETIVYSYEQKPGVKTLAELDEEGGAICTSENLINTSAPALITEPGTYRSEPFEADTDTDAIIAHVEVSVLPGTETIVSQGECGETEEMTLPAVAPSITTKAKPDYLPHELVWDDVIVGGVLPEGGVETIVYSYEQKPGVKTLAELDQQGGAICTPENLINTSAPALITEPGTYRSESFAASTAPDVILAHVEVSVLPGTEVIVSKGECGDVEEMTLPRQLTPAALGNTGQTSAAAQAGGLIAGGLLAFGALLLAAGMIGKKRRGVPSDRVEEVVSQ